MNLNRLINDTINQKIDNTLYWTNKLLKSHGLFVKCGGSGKELVLYKLINNGKETEFIKSIKYDEGDLREYEFD